MGGEGEGSRAPDAVVARLAEQLEDVATTTLMWRLTVGAQQLTVVGAMQVMEDGLRIMCLPREETGVGTAGVAHGAEAAGTIRLGTAAAVVEKRAKAFQDGHPARHLGSQQGVATP